MTYPSEKRPLWAPWRIRYILEERDTEHGCFICEHAAFPERDEENLVIVRGKTCFVFLNLFPYNSGHLLISPFRHIASLSELMPDERVEMFDLLAHAEETIHQVMQPDAFNMGCNLGKAAGAAVDDHVHFHLVPRWSGDTNFMPVIGEVDCVPQALADTARILRKHW